MLSFIILPLAFAASALGVPSRGHHAHQQRHAAVHLEALNLGLRIRPGYKLTWADEFTRTPDSPSPSSSNWIFDIGTSYPGGAPNWGNNEAQFYTNSPENVHI